MNNSDQREYNKLNCIITNHLLYLPINISIVYALINFASFNHQNLYTYYNTRLSIKIHVNVKINMYY
jgi:hypothetical protein